MSNTYKVIDYFDVRGNAKEGFEVNNLCEEPFTITVEDYTNVKEIIQELKKVGFLAKRCRTNMFDVWNDYEMIEFARNNGKPLFRLELKEGK